MKTLHSERAHHRWDRSLPPAMVVAPGESFRLDCREASDGVITPSSTAADLERLDPGRANPVTGPVRVEGARPGDGLVVEWLEPELSGWGWTALIPGFGLLADEIPGPWLLLTRHDRDAVELAPGLRVPTRPFPGTVGVAHAEGEPRPLIPPWRTGGNLDLRDLVPGSRLVLPVEVDGALLSVGDTHAAQGDGEVAGTAVESPMAWTLRVELLPGAAPAFPRVHAPVSEPNPLAGAERVTTTGVGPSLQAAAADSVRGMIDWLGTERDLEPELALATCSVAADLAIAEIVNEPNVVVACRLPLAIFD